MRKSVLESESRCQDIKNKALLARSLGLLAIVRVEELVSLQFNIDNNNAFVLRSLCIWGPATFFEVTRYSIYVNILKVI